MHQVPEPSARLQALSCTAALCLDQFLLNLFVLSTPYH